MGCLGDQLDDGLWAVAVLCVWETIVEGQLGHGSGVERGKQRENKNKIIVNTIRNKFINLNREIIILEYVIKKKRQNIYKIIQDFILSCHWVFLRLN